MRFEHLPSLLRPRSDTAPVLKSWTVGQLIQGTVVSRIGANGLALRIGDQVLSAHSNAASRDNDVPILGEPQLAHLLANVDLGQQIPETLYVAVAEVIAFAYFLRRKRSNSDKDPTAS